jgi:proteasome lid subunit RPN8/RPN11
MVTISLPPEPRSLLRQSLRNAGDREIGGLMMGEQVAPDHFRVVELSLDPVTGSAVHFVRDPARHEAALRSFFERTGGDYRRFNYLGEWHSHPNFPVRPSPEDLGSMQGLVDGERGIDFAALLIVRLRFGLILEAASLMFVRHAEPLAVRLTP